MLIINYYKNKKNFQIDILNYQTAIFIYQKIHLSK